MNERIYELAEQAGFQNGHQDRDGRSLSDELEKFAELIRQDEREACAKLCDARVGIWLIPAGPKECADAIRARENK